jgi:hypothetical protein
MSNMQYTRQANAIKLCLATTLIFSITFQMAAVSIIPSVLDYFDDDTVRNQGLKRFDK